MYKAAQYIFPPDVNVGKRYTAIGIDLIIMSIYLSPSTKEHLANRLPWSHASHTECDRPSAPLLGGSRSIRPSAATIACSSPPQRPHTTRPGWSHTRTATDAWPASLKPLRDIFGAVERAICYQSEDSSVINLPKTCV